MDFMPLNFRYPLAIGITLKLRENWRKEAAHLPTPAKLAAFTLIELSIVLVIIGLIVGGVLVGQDLIRAAQLRSVGADIQKIATASNTFKLKYNCIAGDCLKAETFWGSDASCPNTPANTIAKQATCNGNGNQRVGDMNGTNTIDITEYFRFWQHLANAELIEGKYSGTTGTVSTYDCVGLTNRTEHCYTPKIGGRFFLRYIGYPTGSAARFPTPITHWTTIGKPLANGIPQDKLFTPLEAKMIDEKMDDGKPGTGDVMTYKSAYANTPNCSSTDDEDTAEYRTDLDTAECSLHIRTQIGSY